MDNKVKPKIGLVFFAARWFEEVVLGGGESAEKFTRFLNEDTSKIKKPAFPRKMK